MDDTYHETSFDNESLKTKYYLNYNKSYFKFFTCEHSWKLHSTFCSIDENEGGKELHEFNRFHNIFLNVMLYAIWYHLYNLKNVKNAHEGVLL